MQQFVGQANMLTFNSQRLKLAVIDLVVEGMVEMATDA